jgi:creatinine amidohydrolase
VAGLGRASLIFDHFSVANWTEALGTRGKLVTESISDPGQVLLQELTWPQIRAALAAGKTTAVFACGAVEQHGPHLPTGTDDYLGTAIAERAARIAGNALVAPTLRPGLSEHHMWFPGSFTLRPSTFVALLEDYCESLTRQGFRRIVLFPSHGGNTDTLRAHAPLLARSFEGRSDVVVWLRGDLMQRSAELLAGRGVSLGRAGAHAGFTETSMMLSYRRELVHMEAAEPGRCDDDFYLPENVARSQMESFLHGIQTQSPNGILGDPVGSTADAGDELFDLIARALAAQLLAEPGAVALAQAVTANSV